MSSVERFAADAVEEVAAQSFFQGNAMACTKTVEAVPVFAQVNENLVDFGRRCNVAAEHEFGAEFGPPFCGTRSSSLSTT